MEQQEEEKPEETLAASELTTMQTQLQDYKDKYFRQLAETENMRKRMQKERVEMTQHTLSNIISEFLHPIDHMENALKFVENASDEVKNWATGFTMILTQFKDVLSNNGVTAFNSVGQHFDPNLHEAIETIQTDEHPPGTVLEEHLKGYKMGERTIRPARVIVAKAPQKNEEKKGDES